MEGYFHKAGYACWFLLSTRLLHSGRHTKKAVPTPGFELTLIVP
jgi:hypothetical protein